MTKKNTFVDIILLRAMNGRIEIEIENGLYKTKTCSIST